jgi:Ca-activated chloride channel family protein
MRIVKLMLGAAVAVALCATSAHRPAEARVTGGIVGTVMAADSSTPLAYANVIVLGTALGGMSGQDGKFKIENVPPGTYTVKAMMMGFKAVEKRRIVVRRGEDIEVNFELDRAVVMRTREIVVTDEKKMVEVTNSDTRATLSSEQLEEMPVEGRLEAVALKAGFVKQGDEMYVRGGRRDQIGFSRRPQEPWNTESYDLIKENEFRDAIDHPFSTFSIDVDAASYSNVRRFIGSGQMPPADAVRIEELVNYFSYDYPDPPASEPFSITTEVAGCPWNDDHKLVHVGLQGRRIATEDLPPNNLVFLLDVSGSMQPPNKLPLLKSAFHLLAENLRAEDRIAIVVYAGAAGLVLPSTSGDQKEVILEAIDSLEAGGTTAGGAGIKLAYKIAEDNFIEDGNNRVILATDGDFNTGVSSNSEMVRLIERKRESGVFITVLGLHRQHIRGEKGARARTGRDAAHYRQGRQDTSRVQSGEGRVVPAGWLREPYVEEGRLRRRQKRRRRHRRRPLRHRALRDRARHRRVKSGHRSADDVHNRQHRSRRVRDVGYSYRAVPLQSAGRGYQSADRTDAGRRRPALRRCV